MQNAKRSSCRTDQIADNSNTNQMSTDENGSQEIVNGSETQILSDDDDELFNW